MQHLGFPRCLLKPGHRTQLSEVFPAWLLSHTLPSEETHAKAAGGPGVFPSAAAVSRSPDGGDRRTKTMGLKRTLADMRGEVSAPGVVPQPGHTRLRLPLWELSAQPAQPASAVLRGRGSPIGAWSRSVVAVRSGSGARAKGHACETTEESRPCYSGCFAVGLHWTRSKWVGEIASRKRASSFSRIEHPLTAIRGKMSVSHAVPTLRDPRICLTFSHT